MAHSKSRWEDIARRRDAKKAAVVDEGHLEIGDIAGLERRVEEAIERGDSFLVLRHLKPEDVRYPGLGRRLAEAVLGPFLALKEVEELRSPRWLLREEHRSIWGAVEDLGLVPLVRRAPEAGSEDARRRSSEPLSRRLANLACTLVVDLRDYATPGGGATSGDASMEAEEMLDDEAAFQ